MVLIYNIYPVEILHYMVLLLHFDCEAVVNSFGSSSTVLFVVVVVVVVVMLENDLKPLSLPTQIKGCDSSFIAAVCAHAQCAKFKN